MSNDYLAFVYCFLIPIHTVLRLSFTCENFCNNYLPDLSINMVATHACVHTHIHRNEAIMLKILSIMLICNAQSFVHLCLRWTPITPKIIPYCLYTGRGLAFVLHFLATSAGVRVFCLSKNQTMGFYRQVELPVSVEIVCTASHSFVPRIFNYMGVQNYSSHC